MTPTDTINALEKALEAGPTPGEWTWSEQPGAGIEVRGPYKGSTRLLFSDIWRQFPEQAWDAEMRANAAWVTACSPLAIRTLLDAHASALRDAARYHWLRSRVSGVRDRRGIEEFDMPFVRPCIASIMKGSVAQHFDAAIDAQMAALDDNTKGAAE